MPERRAVAIYARISQDRDGDGLGVTRQLEDCHAEARRRGWTVAEEYVDDDISAFKGKPRPSYRRMLADIRDGSRDAVLVWHMDRLHRQLIELEEFVQTCTRAGLTDVVTLHGDFNLGSGDGLLVARILASVAANESDSKSRRVKREALQRAQAGKPHFGGFRPFGFEPDRVTTRPDEARVIAALAERALAGESLASLCRWLTEEGVRTVGGKEWRTPTVRGLLLNPRYAGLCARHGEVIARGVWPAIIPVEQHERLRVTLTDPARRTNRTARRYLLSGMCRCGRCGAVMASQADSLHGRRYLCRSGHDFGGCGRMGIKADGVEKLVSEMVLYRLDTPELAEALAGRAADPQEAQRLRLRIDQATARMEELATLFADGRIRAEEWVPARDRIEQRRNDARRQLTRLSASTGIESVIGRGSALRAQWPTLNLDRQRAIARTLLDHVVVNPARPGIKYVSPDRVEPRWRL
jgi:DNA invertase Pin-like site-specific DNA recombinase